MPFCRDKALPCLLINPQNEFINPQNEFINPQNEFVDPQNEFVNPQNEFVNPQNEFVNPQNEFVSPLCRDVAMQRLYVSPLSNLFILFWDFVFIDNK